MSGPASVSVILSTYRQPARLRKVLTGYAVQNRRDFELIVADDGSGPETAAVVDDVGRETELNPLHVRQPDRGFRKCRILNEAILASSGDYLIFSDGDCIPRDDFVDAHCRLARPGRFLSGGALPLSRELSDRISVADIRSGRAFDPAWLRRHGWRPGRRRLRVIRHSGVSAILDALTPTRATWNGGNASTWRSAAVEVNGFEESMVYGGEDRAFGERLVNLGLRGRQVRHRAVCLHLHHERPYKTRAGIAGNDEIREQIRARRSVRAQHGLVERSLENDA